MLKGRHPEMWPTTEEQTSRSEGVIEVEVSGHCPVIVRQGMEGSDSPSLIAISDSRRWRGTLRAKSTLEMVDMLVAQGMK